VAGWQSLTQLYKGSLASRKRLVNILRSILHRKTHESRFMGRPLIEIPKITERVIAVNLCEAESFLYKALTDLFIAKINSKFQSSMIDRIYCVVAILEASSTAKAKPLGNFEEDSDANITLFRRALPKWISAMELHSDNVPQATHVHQSRTHCPRHRPVCCQP
jgi:hypothetical protein